MLDDLFEPTVKNNQILAIKMHSKRTNWTVDFLSISLKSDPPTFKNYFVHPFPRMQVEWKDIYLLSIKVFIYTICACSNKKYQTIFHALIKRCKVLNFVVNCWLKDEKINHLFVGFHFAIKFWSDLNYYYYRFCLCNLHCATFRFFEIDHVLCLPLDGIRLLDKNYTYSSLEHFLKNIKNYFVRKNIICNENEKKSIIKSFNQNREKWRC